MVTAVLCGVPRYATWLCLLVSMCAACAKPAPLPKLPAPTVIERIDAVPPLPSSSFAVALGLDLRLLEPLLTDLLNNELPLRQADWTRVTGQGANPQVETRMQARVATIKLGMKDDVLHIKARIAYWGKARAQLATPFGKAWLSHGTDWGTEKRPGSVLLTLALTPKLSRAFALTTRTILDEVSFEAPPGDSLCGRIVIKVCVPREQAAKQVHAALKDAIEGASPKLLAELDRRVVRQTDVASSVALALRTLEQSTPSLDHTWLKLAVEEVALGALTGKGARVSLPLELRLRAVFGVSEPDVPRELPARQDPQGVPTDLTFDLPVGFTHLAQGLSAALSGKIEAGFRVTRLGVLGVDKTSGRLVVSLSLVREQEELTVYAEADPILQGDKIVLSGLRFTDRSRAALRPLGLEESRLRTLLGTYQGMALDALSGKYLDALRVKLQAPLVLFGTLGLSFEGVPTFEGLRYTRQGLVVRLHGRAHSKLR